ncbi:N-6 DNA methylase [Arcobacter cryaerophilus gv. pseudocryaerophilus]|uniref:N-6 DNA methylase n=3 Tax=Arcobacteraceae TaxID=2808963 RepID=A0AA96IJ79_9BACT|nr:N-6 DNA methylase [Arcobacter sp. AZ-2023]WNL36201.1 N-6 DNA methylase [Arcobacter sp. AZ-2023]WPD11917.1 N-6 DNA methylase [Arcobacter sp. DSM 115960]
MTTKEVIETIFKDKNVKYDLTEFLNFKKPIEEILTIEEKTTESGEHTGKYFLKTLAPFASGTEEVQVYSNSGKSAPEEIVRQLWVYKLINELGYKEEEILLEQSIHFGTEVHHKAADIVIYTGKDKESAKIIVETKKPNGKEGIEQLKSYLNAQGAIGVWSNGSETVILYREKPSSPYETLSRIPKRNQTVEDLRKEAFTIKDLDRHFNFKKIIEELEELVLADSGADEFNEIFKLIFAKIWDEKSTEDDKSKELEFRQLSTPAETYERINSLFNKAKDEWSGVFKDNEKIELRKDHLHICIAPLEKKRLLGSNLRIIDDAFEYLIPAEAKKKKGQFFTPRYVIDMCVRMINPKKTEYTIDPACGSAGFLLHAMEWCYPAETQEELDLRKWKYAQKYLWGIDFEARAVKASKSLMLIAGDGHTNIHGPDVSGIDPRTWLSTQSGHDLMNSLRKTKLLKNKPPEGATITKEDEAWQYFKEFNFDVVLSNPPFAGEIKDKKTLSEYELAKPALARAKNKQAKEERDVLFIERIINMLKDGGRTAIVLPQGKFNNASLSFIRNYVLSKARLLAVVGLHQNSFKPHTGVKTSVMILQKYTKQELKAIEKIKKEVEETTPDYISKIIQLIESNTDFEKSTEDIPEDILDFLIETFSEVEIESDIDPYEEYENILSKIETIEKNLKNQDENNTKNLKNEQDYIKERKKELPNKKIDRSQQEEQEFQRLELRRKELTEEIKLSREADNIDKPKRAELKVLQEELEVYSYQINIKSIKGQLSIILENDYLIQSLRDKYIIKETAKKLDYPIFMAVSNKGGKNNSGDYEFKTDKEGFALEGSEGNLLVEQDLVNYELKKEDLENIENIPEDQFCIAEAFIKFAKEQNLNFWS